MKTRQEGIESKSIVAATTVSTLMTPGHPPSPKTAIIAKLNAEATAKTYDSTKDPIVLAASLGTGIVSIPHGGTFVFPHALGYIPIVQIVTPDTGYIGLWVQDLTDMTCTIYNYNHTSSTAHIKIYCH
jgi:hypothetical protein